MKKSSVFISIILVLALVAGGAAVAITSIPHVKVYRALDNTLFNSSELNIIVRTEYGSDNYDEKRLDIVIGDDINSSSLTITEVSSFDDESYTSSLNGGKFYNNDGEASDETVEDLLKSLEEEFEDYLPEGTDIVEVVNDILNNKIDKKAVKKTYDDILVPAIENFISEEFDEEIELPKFKELTNRGMDIIKEKDITESLEFEKIDSDLPGTTYEYTLDVAQLIEAALNYAMEDEEFSETIDQIAESLDTEAEDLVDDIIEGSKDFEDITGTITIKSNRITNITYNINDDDTLIITIESKK